MADKHKWHDVIVAMANGLDVQYEHNGGWYKLTDKGVNPFAYPHWEWRVKPKTIMIGGMEVPAPIKDNLNNGNEYYIPAVGMLELQLKLTWNDFTSDFKFVKSGMAHHTAEDAKKHAEALIKISGGTV